MRTDDLIKALSEDARNVEPPIDATIAIGSVSSQLLFLWLLGPRPDFSEVITGVRPLSSQIRIGAQRRLSRFYSTSRPVEADFAAGRRLCWFGRAPALLAISGLFEMISLPSNVWHARMIGQNSSLCVTMIPLLSLAPLAAVLYALKEGIPANPIPAGAIGGLLFTGRGELIGSFPSATTIFVCALPPAGPK